MRNGFPIGLSLAISAMALACTRLPGDEGSPESEACDRGRVGGCFGICHTVCSSETRNRNGFGGMSKEVREFLGVDRYSEVYEMPGSHISHFGSGLYAYFPGNSSCEEEESRAGCPLCHGPNPQTCGREGNHRDDIRGNVYTGPGGWVRSWDEVTGVGACVDCHGIPMQWRVSPMDRRRLDCGDCHDNFPAFRDGRHSSYNVTLCWRCHGTMNELGAFTAAGLPRHMDRNRDDEGRTADVSPQYFNCTACHDMELESHELFGDHSNCAGCHPVPDDGFRTDTHDNGEVDFNN